MIKLKDILQERIPKLPRINMGFGEAQDYSKMMIKKSEEVIKFTRDGNMGKAKKIVKDMEEIVTQIKRVLGI
jgi:predicted translin family RNA/ssDNA-binding protein